MVLIRQLALAKPVGAIASLVSNQVLESVTLALRATSEISTEIALPVLVVLFAVLQIRQLAWVVQMVLFKTRMALVVHVQLIARFATPQLSASHVFQVTKWKMELVPCPYLLPARSHSIASA